MTVIERLYDNAWYVANASGAAREALGADVTRAWMERESTREAVEHARLLADATQLSLSLSSAGSTQAVLDRAKARAAEAARCTDIVGGHAFCIRRETGAGGAMTMELSSCTLVRRVTLRVAGRGECWTVVLHDPRSQVAATTSQTWGTDPWEALHRACDWITQAR